MSASDEHDEEIISIAQARQHFGSGRTWRERSSGGRRTTRPRVPGGDHFGEPFPSRGLDDEPIPSDEQWDPNALFEPANYDVGHFYTNTSIGEDGSTQIRASISRVLVHRIEAIVQQRRVYEYQTVQDFIRDAIYHRLMWVTEMLPHAEQIENMEALQVAGLISDMESSRQRRDTMEKATSLIHGALEQALADRDGDRFDRLVRKADGVIESMTEPWRTQMQRMLSEARRRRQSMI